MTSLHSNQTHCTISLLPLSSFPAKEHFAAALHSFENKQLRLSCFQPLQPFQSITVEHGDRLFLGEVVTCTAKPNGSEWIVLIKVELIVTALQSLLRLREQLFEAEGPSRPARLREAALAA